MKPVHCDQCGQTFPIEVKDRPLRGGGKERFFRCPHCKHKYVVARFTPLGVKLAQEIQQVEAQINRQPNSDNTALRERLVELRTQLRPEVSGA